MSTSANVSIINLEDGRQVCLSYGVIVAAFIPRTQPIHVQTDEDTANARKAAPSGYLRTDARFSVTTSRHMNQFAGKESPLIPHAELLRLCSPVASRQ